MTRRWPPTIGTQWAVIDNDGYERKITQLLVGYEWVAARNGEVAFEGWTLTKKRAIEKGTLAVLRDGASPKYW